METEGKEHGGGAGSEIGNPHVPNGPALPADARSAGRPRSHDVFISYSSRDVATANAVCDALEASGIRCWIAPRDVPVGRSWKASIVEAIRAARAIVLVFSGTANGSEQVKREVDIAFESAPPIPIFPFRIEDVRMSDDLYYCIGDRHWLDAITPPLDAHTDRLVTALREAGYCAEPDGTRVTSGRAPSAPSTPSVPNDVHSDAVADASVVDAESLHDVDAIDAPVATIEPPAAGDWPDPGRRSPWALAAVLIAVIAALGIALAIRPGVREIASTPIGRSDTARPSASPPSASPPSAAPIASGQTTTEPPQASATVPVRRPTPVASARSGRARGESGATDSAAVRAVMPESLKVECARLLERASLGEALSASETLRLRRDCRGTPL